MLLCAKIAIGTSLFGGGVLIILGSVLGFKVLPDMVEEQIGEKVRLENGTEQYERWQEVPFPLSFSVYYFNVENSAEVMAGLKPIVREVGPFTYNQKRTKIDIAYEENNNHFLTYKQMQNYEFNPTASGEGLTEDTQITTFNVPLYGIFQSAEFGSDELLAALNAFIQYAFPDTRTMFHTISARDYMFGGYSFCKTADLLAAPSPITAIAMCSRIKGQMGGIKTMEVEASLIRFAFFRYKDAAHDGTYKIMSGMDDPRNTGSIQTWEEMEYLKVWVGENSRCNRIEGTDAAIYPPFNSKDRELTVFSSDICRTVQLQYDGEIEYEGIDGYRSIMKPDSFNNNNNNECYCTEKTRNLNGEFACLPNGFVDMVNCLSSQIVLSFPHLLNADPEYADTVIGLSPDSEKHSTFVEMQPDSGSPLRGGKRVQFNMFVRPLPDFIKANSLPRTVMPILWIEEGTNLPPDLVQKLKDDLISKLKLVEGLKWGLLVSGIVIFVIGAGFLIYFMCFRKVRTLR